MMDLEAVNQFSKSLTEETNRLIKIRALATDISAKALYKAEFEPDGSAAHYEAFENIPVLNDIAEETAQFIKDRLDKYLEDKSAKLEDCVAAMMAEFGLAQGNDLGKVTAGLNRPGNSLNNSKQSKNQQEDKKICATGKANTPS